MKTPSATRTFAEQRRLHAFADNLEAAARMLRRLAEANERSEPIYLACLSNDLPAARLALAAVEAECGEANAAEAVRWPNEAYAEASKAAGGTLTLKAA